jgi:Alginate lyase
LVHLGERAGVDLWNYRTADGRSISKALDYLIPFGLGKRKWEHQQLGEWQPQMLFPLLRRAAIQYPQYRALLSKLPEMDAADRNQLLLPMIKEKK